MAIETGTTDVGLGRPGTSVRQLDNGISEFEETRENGTHKVTSVWPDGTVHRTIERTDPSTGITTKIERHEDGRLEKTIESPGGQIQSTTTFPDGHKEGYRAFKGPDGSSWTQGYGKDERLVTTRDSVDPDGTQRHVVKNADGTIQTTTTKVTMQEDGSKMTQIKSPNGDIQTKIERPDGTSETSTMHPDGTDELVAVFREPDGTMVTRHVAANGAEAVDRQWTSPDGHVHRSVKDFDGTVRNYENWEDVQPDGTVVIHHNSPLSQETTTRNPNGSYETIKNHSDGTVSRFTHKQNPDGSVDEFHLRSDGKTSESHYRENPDGSVTTHTVDYNGLDRTTMVGRDGRVEVNVTHPDGSRTNTSYSADGSGRIEYLDANGHPDGYTDIQPDPAPVPTDYANPDDFIGPALREIPPNIGAPAPVEGDAPPPEFGASPLPEGHQTLLEQHGVQLPEALDPSPETAASETAEPAIGEGAMDVGMDASRTFHAHPDGIEVVEKMGPPQSATKTTYIGEDGSVRHKIARADSSTGIETEVVREKNGDITTTVDSPGGQRQVTIQHPDGSQEVHRMFRGPDGSDWSQHFGPNGVSTRHTTYDPDGTLRAVEKLPDGTVEVTTSRSWSLSDGTQMSEVHAPNGDVFTTISGRDGTSEARTVHPDGTQSVSKFHKEADGTGVITHTAEDGSITTTREWTEQDGSLVRTVTNPDGNVERFRTYDHKNPDGSTVHTEESPDGIVITTKSGGNIERTTQHPDGSVDRYSLKTDGDEATVKEVLADGSTHETHIGPQGMDLSLPIRSRGFDGVQTNSTMQKDGSIATDKLNPDGSKVETRYDADGSGHTTTFDANGNPISETDIAPTPSATPRNFEPDRFLDDAQNELPVSAPADPGVMATETGIDMTGEPYDSAGAVHLTEDQQAFLEEHGVEVPMDVQGGPTEDGGVEIGGDHRVRMYHGTPEGTTLIETLPDGTRKLISVDPDGKVFNTLERVDPSTGIETTVSRRPDGQLTTKIESPGGDSQETIRHPDGSEEITRTFTGSDGTKWSQVTNKDGVRTTHQTVDPDGTVRLTEKLPDGTVQVNTTKTMNLDDGTSIIEIHSPNGDVTMMATRADGTSEMRIHHPDGTDEYSAIMTDADGTKITTNAAVDGSLTTTREWTAQDGSTNKTITHPDGQVDEYRTYDYKDNGATVHVEESPTGTVTTKNWANGNIEKETQDPDGNISRYSYTKNPDGSAVEREELATGPTSETHYSAQNLDGSYTTVERGFDGVETRTTLDENGRATIRKLNPDGTSVENRYNPDGSGHSTTFDANGNPTGDTPIAPVPTAVPRNFDPSRFEADAQRELPPQAEIFTPEVQTEPQREFSATDLEELSARGIVGPDVASELDHDTELEPVASGLGVSDDDLGFPPGALGDVDWRNHDEITKEPIAWDNVHGKPGTVFTEEADGSIHEGMPYDDTPGPQEWPEEKIVGMEPIEEHEPIGPDPDAHPLEESMDAADPDLDTTVPEPEPDPDPSDPF